jgi:hypothetical protein
MQRSAISILDSEGYRRTPGELDNALREALGTLRGTPNALRELLLTRRRTVHQIAGDLMLSAEGMKAKTTLANEAATAGLERIRSAANTARERVVAVTTDALNPPQTTEEAALQALNDQATWRRLERQLEAGVSPEQLIAQVAQANDPAGLRVLRAELPTCVNPAGDRQEYLNALNRILDQAELPLLAPVARRARELQQELAAGWYQLTCSFNYAASEITGGGPCDMLLAWEKGEVVPVEERA